MMRLVDLHIHTTYSDGKNTPEEMVLAAIEKNIDSIGFSDHSYTAFDNSYCIKKSEIQNYKNEISQLKEKYKDKIEILCGVEQDFYSDEPICGYDYVIGSVHYLKVENDYIPIDFNAETLLDAVKKHYGGDIYKMTDDYFRTVSKIKNADIIGHFDLISKFNENFTFFDEYDKKYVASYKKALDVLLKQDVIFEINTGAISRGFKTKPYPNEEMISYILQNGGKIILSSDAHDKETIMFDFDKYRKYLS